MFSCLIPFKNVLQLSEMMGDTVLDATACLAAKTRRVITVLQISLLRYVYPVVTETLQT